MGGRPQSAQSEESEGPSVDSWSDKDQSIHVRSVPGFLFDLVLRSRLEGTPDEVYAVLTVQGVCRLPGEAWAQRGGGGHWRCMGLD
jgi:hypothetical protein